MAIIKPYKNDLWFHLPQKQKGDVDRQAIYFGRNGEFNPYSDIAFEKHMIRLNGLAHNPIFFNYNGQRIKKIREAERFWY